MKKIKIPEDEYRYYQHLENIHEKLLRKFIFMEGLFEQLEIYLEETQSDYDVSFFHDTFADIREIGGDEYRHLLFQMWQEYRSSRRTLNTWEINFTEEDNEFNQSVGSNQSR